MAGERSLGDRSDGCLHRDVLLFDARQNGVEPLQGVNRKRRAKPRRQGKSLRRLADRVPTNPVRQPVVSPLPPKWTSA
jgi:hypothetical protein